MTAPPKKPLKTGPVVETPVPTKGTTCGVAVALSVMVSVPVTTPAAVGVNCTPTSQATPGARLLGLLGQLLLETENTLGVATMLVKVKEAAPGLATFMPRLAICVPIPLLVLPTAHFPKFIILRWKSGTGPDGETPVPVRLMMCGLPGALSVMVSVPLNVPIPVGVKITSMSQPVPGGMVSGQNEVSGE